LCIWEEIIERTDKRPDAWHAVLVAYRRCHGTAALLHASIELAA
jgi:hypothetical protein